MTLGAPNTTPLSWIGRRLPPALKYPAYFRFWLGMFAAVGGFQVMTFGQYWLVHQLTPSPLYLGYTGLANALPAILLNLFGGVAADKLNRKRLIVVTEYAAAFPVLLLAFLTLFHVVRIWHVLLIAVVAGAINAFNQPARQAVFPSLIERPALMSAVALNSAVWQGTRIIAPAVAGILIALWGTASAFLVAGAGMCFFGWIVSRLPIPEERREGEGAMRQMAEGLRYVWAHSIFTFLMSMTFFNSFFGMAYVAQMPVFARDILNVGAEGQGLLLSLSGIGSLLATAVLSVWAGALRRGTVLIGGAILSGLSVAGFALGCRYVGSYPLAMALMFLIGVFNSTYMISIMSALQMMVPDQMRGRVMGLYGMTWNIMPLGGMYAGLAAVWLGTPWAIALGGFLVTVFAAGPALWNRDVRRVGALMRSAECAPARRGA
jgi:MFS family permease